MRYVMAVLGLLLLATPSEAQNATGRYYPDHNLTPGSVDAKLKPAFLCAHSTSERRNTPDSLKRQVFEAYNVSWDDRSGYEVDHFIPLFLGGVNKCDDSATCNLWPQPHQKVYADVAPWGSETKDRLEMRVYNTMCNRKAHKALKDVTWLRDAQNAMMSDWRAMYREYFGEPGEVALGTVKRIAPKFFLSSAEQVKP